MHPQPCRLAASPEDYERFKLEKRHIQQWEDGLRIDPPAPNLEWWYCDADLDDGAKLALIFATKDGTRLNQPLEPQLEVDLTLPDGTRLIRYDYFKPEEFSASKAGCDARMGPVASRATCTSTGSQARPVNSGPTSGSRA